MRFTTPESVVIDSVTPIGNYAPKFKGQIYINDSTDDVYKATGLGDTDWALMSSLIQTREIFEGNSNAVGNGADIPLTWDNNSGDELLDLTTLDTPTVFTAGVYAVSVTVNPDAITVGGYYTATLKLDGTGADVTMYQNAVSTTNLTGPQITLSCTFYIPAGGTIQVYVNNNDGVSSVDYKIGTASIQRLS